ncbi:5180_t:CDS:1, partial [Paraglomus brasilianum]
KAASNLKRVYSYLEEIIEEVPQGQALGCNYDGEYHGNIDGNEIETDNIELNLKE